MNIEKAAVLGAGVMGAAIAAHLANAGISVDLLDVVPEDGRDRNAIAAGAVAKLLKADPPPFMHPDNARLLTPANIEDDLARLAQADWVIEAVLEDPAIKRALYRKLDAVCRQNALISSNTSTLPLRQLTKGLPDSFKRRFMITHFFNPPRYMRLLEVVANDDLQHGLLDGLCAFAAVKLGKTCVICNDTPGFIANRIGTFWLQTALFEAFDLQVSVEQADACMGLFGIPKTGVFGLLDLVGLDLLPHVLDCFKQTLPAEDRLSAIAFVPELMRRMIDNGLTGRKGQGGFYRLQTVEGRKIKESLDLQSGAYKPSEPFQIEGVAANSGDLRRYLSGDGKLQRYAWRVAAETLSYCAALVPEIAGDIAAVDTAMRLGYNWRYGPFELLDSLGVDWFAARLEAEKCPVPALLSNRQSFYRSDAGSLRFRDVAGAYRPLRRSEGVLLLGDIKLRAPPLLENASASCWDIGDGVVCVEFHSKMNTLDIDTLTLIRDAVGIVDKSYQALVIYNEAENFSAGANLNLLVSALLQQDWDTVEDLIRRGQNAYQALKYASFPVVGAPAGLALGGGCEILLHCDAIQAHAELYMGLVETGAGLVPGWGGCKELLRRWLAHPKRPGGPLPPIAQTFETIGLAKVSKSAQEARGLLFLSRRDGITMHRDRLLADAKARALSLAADYRPPEPYVYALPGASAWASLDSAARNLQLAGKASAYDVEIARQLARVLSGGDTDISRPLTERQLLDLELDAFLFLVQQPGTLARLQHLLKTGKPLRN